MRVVSDPVGLNGEAIGLREGGGVQQSELSRAGVVARGRVAWYVEWRFTKARHVGSFSTARIGVGKRKLRLHVERGEGKREGQKWRDIYPAPWGGRMGSERAAAWRGHAPCAACTRGGRPGDGSRCFRLETDGKTELSEEETRGL